MSYQSHTCHNTCGQTVHPTPTTPRPSCPWPTLKFHVQDKNTSLGIAAATLTLTNFRHTDQEKIKIITEQTGENGVWKNIKLKEEHVRVVATAEGYDSWTADFEFTCNNGGCKNCEMVKIIELPKMAENETFCENVTGSVEIKDLANNLLANVAVDIYKLPLDCALPPAVTVTTTTTTTTVPAAIRIGNEDSTTEPLYLTNLSKHEKRALNRVAELVWNPSSLRNQDISTNCTELKVVENERTDHKGVVVFPVKSKGHYIVRNITHPDYTTTETAGSVHCTRDQCDYCKLEMSVNMTKTGCDNATLHIHVRNNVTDDAIHNATINIFTNDIKVNTETLFSNTLGEVVYNVEDNGEYNVIVSAPGMVSVEESSVTKCNVTDCNKCQTLFKFFMPPTEVPPVCDNSTLNATITDVSTEEIISTGLRITLTFSPFNETSTTIIAENVTSIENFPIIENGNYSIQVLAEGYKETSQHVIFNCSMDDCEDCSQHVNITLEEDFCQRPELKLKVTDEGVPVSGAAILLYKEGTWDSSKVLFSESTDTTGVATIRVGGRADYNVRITKDGYEEKRTTINMFCKAGKTCEECGYELEVEIEEIFCNETVELSAIIMNKDSNPIENATVTFILKKTINGPQSQVIEEPVKTNSFGVAQQNIQQFGIYTVNVTAEGFLSESRDINVENNTACMNQTLSLSFTLPEKEESFCANTSLVVTVTDRHTGAILANANVTVALGVSFSNLFPSI